MGLVSSPWPVFHHDLLNTGRTDIKTFVKGVIKWTFDAGNPINNTPVIGADGTLYFQTETFAGGSLYAINPDGTQKWIFNTGQTPGQTLPSSPVIDSNGIIYIGSNNGNLYAVNPDGSQKWVFGSSGLGEVRSPNIASDGTIYIGTANSAFYAVNPDGSQKWAFNDSGDPNFGTVSGGCPAIDSNGVIYFGTSSVRLYAVNPNGTKKWLFDGRISSADLEIASPAIDSNGVVYIGSSTSTNCRLYAVNPNGTQKWAKVISNVNGINGTVAIGSNGILYVQTFSIGFFAINPSDGSNKWTFAINGASSAAIDGLGNIYVCSSNGKFYAFDPSGNNIFNVNVGANSFSSPVIGSDGTVYINTGNILTAIISINPVANNTGVSRSKGRGASEQTGTKCGIGRRRT